MTDTLEPREDHYNPRTYLRSWSVNRGPFVRKHCFGYHGNHTSDERSVASLCYEIGGDLIDNDPKLTAWLVEYRRGIEDVWESIVDQVVVQNITDEGKEIISKLCILMMLYTPDGRECMTAAIKMADEQAETWVSARFPNASRKTKKAMTDKVRHDLKRRVLCDNDARLSFQYGASQFETIMKDQHEWVFHYSRFPFLTGKQAVSVTAQDITYFPLHPSVCLELRPATFHDHRIVIEVDSKFSEEHNQSMIDLNRDSYWISQP